MDNSEILSEINLWRVELQNRNNFDNLIELAFFKIFIKFEKYLSQIFIHYATGKKSKLQYKTKRKLGFTTPDQLYNIIKGGGERNHVDIPKLISNGISPHIFRDGYDPFALIFNDVEFTSNYRKMILIRNYIAHESDESRSKYVDSVLRSFNIQSFIPVNEFLMKNKRNGVTYYTYFINILIDYSNILLNPAPYLANP
jgi:hypothetical protein